MVQVRHLCKSLGCVARDVDAFRVHEADGRGGDGLRLEPRTGEDELWPIQRVSNELRHEAATGIVLVHKEQPKDIRTLVLAIFARAHVKDFLTDVLCLIRHTLEPPGDGH